MKFETLPNVPCDSCLGDPKRQAHGADGSMIALHCPHNLAGAVYRPQSGMWTVVSPVDQDGFADYCARLGALHMRTVAHEDGLAPAGKAH